MHTHNSSIRSLPRQLAARIMRIAPPGPRAEAACEETGVVQTCSCQEAPAETVMEAEKGTGPGKDEQAFALAIAALADLADDAMGGVEGLDRASCSPNIKYLAQIGMGAAARGCSQEGWRAQVALTQGLDATRELDQAEECMRLSGLWPWA